jgi:serralysin
VDGTATVSDDDYTAVPPTFITFNPGESSKTITVAVKGDTKFEPNETFGIKLIQSLNSSVTKTTGIATINNNDKQTIAPPTPTTPPTPTSPGDTKPVFNEITGTSGDDILSGTSRAEIIVGEDGNDTIRGLGGDDLLFGSNGNDKIYGGDGNDRIYGRDGTDQLSGDAGDDVLIGGFRNDVLTGGVGKDQFEFRRPKQGIDRITDFSLVDDTIVMWKSDFKSGLKAGIVTADQFRVGAKALDQSDRVIYNPVTGGFFFDADGSGGIKQVQLAQLTKGVALTRQDVVII